MRKVIVIGMDTAEYSLVTKWNDDGTLPNLKKLMMEGTFGLMDSYAPHLPGANWYSFYLSQQPGMHGLYGYIGWRPEKMKADAPAADWAPVVPFWHRLQEQSSRGLIINVPDTFIVNPFNGIELLSIASDHMLTPLQSNPKYYSRRVSHELRRIHYHEEKYGPVALKEFLQIRDDMIELTGALQDLTIKMMSREPWDLLVTVLPGVHRAGHRLWSTVNIRDIKTPAEQTEAADALRQVYIATDHAIGRIMKAAGEECTFLIFSTHGMTHNHSREAILPEMLSRVLDPDRGHQKRNGVLKKLRDYIPLSIRHGIKATLPLPIRKQMTLFWRLGQLDWRKTRAFVIPLEVRIGIRINLEGREAQGIVPAGDSYEKLCKSIIEGLKTFVDADTGKPLIKELLLARDVFDGERVGWLPDIVGSWNDDSAASHHRITSPLYGDIPWPTPGYNPEGRSGNHNNQGFLIAYGRDVLPGEIQNVHVLDLAPTILSLLGETIPPQLQGKVLPIVSK